MGDSLDTMDSDTMVVSDTTARGLLMLRLRLILTTPTDMVRTGIRWTPSRIPRFLRLRKVNYIIIFQQTISWNSDKNGLLSVRTSLHQCCSFSATIKSLVMVSRKQE